MQFLQLVSKNSMVGKMNIPDLELKAPSNKKENLKGNLVKRSELPKEFKDFNRFNPKNQSMYKNPFKKKR